MKSFLRLAAWAARILPAPIKRLVYRIRPAASLIRRTLNRAAPPGLSEVRVAAGSLRGMPLMLNMQKEKSRWLGTYETEIQASIQREIKPGMVVYDVGANIGYVSLMFARAVGDTGHVFAFEALPANLERMRANLALNPAAPVHTVPMAVVDACRTVEFLTHSSTSMGKAAGSAGREHESYGAAIQVSGVSLDEFVYTQCNPLPHVVKMDIEGGEVLALPGMRRLLREAHPLIFLELHGPEAAQVAWTELTTAGYRLFRMNNGAAIPALDRQNWKNYVIARYSGS